jgi:hypothetical protein
VLGLNDDIDPAHVLVDVQVGRDGEHDAAELFIAAAGERSKAERERAVIRAPFEPAHRSNAPRVP